MSLKDPLIDYLDYIKARSSTFVSRNMDGNIPISLINAIQLAKKKLNSGRRRELAAINSEYKEKLGRIYERTTRKLNAFTDKARESLELHYNDGIGVEVAHQPKFIGGEKFIFNKLALGGLIAMQESSFFPFFYLADYDKVHPELIKTHFSLVNSSSGFVTSISNQDEKMHDGTGIRDVPLPSESYLDRVMKIISKNFTFSINTCIKERNQKQLLMERLDAALMLIKLAYHESSNYGEWFLNIISKFTNVIDDFGYLFIMSSDPDYRQLLTPAYEYLLKYREKYVHVYRQIRERFVSHGYKPPLREISKNFVPFFYECPEKGCFHQRVTLTAEVTDTMIILQGRCERCGTLHEIITNKTSPDLTDVALFLTPRVESRQYLVSKTAMPGIHVAGTGETRYYTMSIPIIKEVDATVLTPIIYFYNKITSNNFITRYLERKIIKIVGNEFLDKIKSLMKVIGRISKLMNIENGQIGAPDDDERIRKDLIVKINISNEMAARLEEFCSSAQDTIKSADGKNILSSYISNLFGRISSERHGQEAVFHWIDLALNNGIPGIFKDYKRIYMDMMPPGLNLFI
ncbi:MAG: hypothetical protein ACTSYS_01150 [Promethearchaeota archaeon]